MLPLNEPRLGVGGLGQRQVHRARAGEFDVGAGGIEVRVVGNDMSGLAHHGEQDAFGGAALVSGDHVAEAGESWTTRFRRKKLSLPA